MYTLNLLNNFAVSLTQFESPLKILFEINLEI